MHLFDWLLVVLPLLAVLYIAYRTQRYTQDLSDFLVAGRVAGRYVLAVSDGTAAMGLISLVAMFELYYQSGFAIGFWQSITFTLLMLAALTGFITYRFRETRAMTLSQFFEIRYSRKFRVFTGVLQAVAGIVNYGLFPAVGARFLIYYTDLPLGFEVFGLIIPTYAIVMFLFLSIAVLIVCLGGQVTVMVTDCLQGIFSYPMYVILIMAVIFSFSWSEQISPVLLDQPAGKSFLNPFDTSQLRDFNIFYILVGAFASVYNLASWSGTQGYRAAAISPHEQKMARVLGAWRSGFCNVMYILLAMAALVYMSHADFRDKATKTEQSLSWKTLNDIAAQDEYAGVEATEELIEARKESLSLKDRQVFDTISNQMRVPVVLRDIFPVGITGVFCAFMVFLMISTDTTYLHSWGSIIVQDVVLPAKKKQISTRRHLLYLRLAILGVAIYAFVFSYFFGQVTYILMFFALTGSLWLGGAGVVIIGGLYWKRGTTAAAWTSLILGGMLSVLGFICTQYWGDWIYPMISQNPETLNCITSFFESISKPFEPIVIWRVTPDRFPINGQEIFFLVMFFSIFSYVMVSLLTCKKSFNMDRMLHRGKYRSENDAIESVVSKVKAGFAKKFFNTFVGIDSTYTKGDKILAWAVFSYNFIFLFVINFLAVVLWNTFISKWTDKWWSTYYFIQYFIVAVIIGVVSTIWFFIGGILDLRKLFVRLRSRQRNELDDGRVIGHINADELEKIESINGSTNAVD